MAEEVNATVHKQEPGPSRSTVWKQAWAESSSGHYGSWNALCRWVNIGKSCKPETVLSADISLKLKSCFRPPSSVKNFIQGAKYQCQDISVLGKSNIMFCNIATANSTFSPFCITGSFRYQLRIFKKWDCKTIAKLEAEFQKYPIYHEGID